MTEEKAVKQGPSTHFLLISTVNPEGVGCYQCMAPHGGGQVFNMASFSFLVETENLKRKCYYFIHIRV